MQKLSFNNFPVAGMANLIFRTKDGILHQGSYLFNDLMQRRWIDSDGNEYTSDMVDEWEEEYGMFKL